jgi:pimeloyl-ACP methyl ester carboxylesterase
VSARGEHPRALRNRAYEDHAGLRPPGWLKLMLEARAPAEFGAGLLSLMFTHRLPRGDGQPVVVFPGLAASDTSTLLLRQFMRRLGYPGYGWAQGFNVGPRHGVVAGCRERLVEIADKYGRKVSLVGWSLGGVYAREVAKLHPELVRQVITLGSPFAGPPRATNAHVLFRLLSGHSAEDPRLLEHLREPPPVPFTSIYSRTDGVVHWQCSVQRHGRHYENIEVRASHLGIGFNPLALYAVADRLAQQEGRWRPFPRHGLRGLIYGAPHTA